MELSQFLGDLRVEYFGSQCIEDSAVQLLSLVSSAQSVHLSIIEFGTVSWESVP